MQLNESRRYNATASPLPSFQVTATSAHRLDSRRRVAVNHLSCTSWTSSASMRRPARARLRHPRQSWIPVHCSWRWTRTRNVSTTGNLQLQLSLFPCCNWRLMAHCLRPSSESEAAGAETHQPARRAGNYSA